MGDQTCGTLFTEREEVRELALTFTHETSNLPAEKNKERINPQL